MQYLWLLHASVLRILYQTRFFTPPFGESKLGFSMKGAGKRGERARAWSTIQSAGLRVACSEPAVAEEVNENTGLLK